MNRAFLFVKVLNQILLKIPTFKRFISAVKATEQIMNEWSDDESNAVAIVILPPDNVESLTDDEEVQDDDVMIDNGFASDVLGTMQVQTNFSNG